VWVNESGDRWWSEVCGGDLWRVGPRLLIRHSSTNVPGGMRVSLVELKAATANRP
jgi:hypothetical protein